MGMKVQLRNQSLTQSEQSLPLPLVVVPLSLVDRPISVVHPTPPTPPVPIPLPFIVLGWTIEVSPIPLHRGIQSKVNTDL